MTAAEAVEAFNLLVRRWHGLSQIEDHHERMMATYEVRHAWEPRVADLLKHAEEGGPDLWHALGYAFQWGRGVERDVSAAERWYERAALAGKVRSMVALALCKQRSESRSEREAAVSWLRKGASLGDTHAMVSLGFAYRSGQGVDSDFHSAVEWFTRAYEAGDLRASMHAGRTFVDHVDDATLALPWLLRAADAECKESYIYLAMIFDDRKSGHYDPVEAVKWYQTVVSEHGMCVPRATLALARHYRDGTGVDRSPETAKGLLKRLMTDAGAGPFFRKEAEKLYHEMEGDLI